MGKEKAKKTPKQTLLPRDSRKTRLPSLSPQKTGVDKATAVKKATTVKTPSIKAAPPSKQLSIIEEAEQLLAKEVDPTLNGTGLIKVRFNHYNKTFPIHNGVLRWASVDEEYSISFVYRGNFKRDLRQELSGEGRNIKTSETNCRRDENGIYFLGLTANADSDAEPVTYSLWLEEDPVAGVGAEGLRLREGPLVAAKTGAGALQSGNKAVNDITNSLLNMKSSDLHSQEANDLRERRDLEDILYSSS